MASCGMQPAKQTAVNQNDSQELAKVFQQVAERSSRILGEFAQKQSQSMSAAVRDEMGIAKAFMDLYTKLAADPALLASMSVNLWVDQWRLWQSSWMKMLGMESQAVAPPPTGGWRFKDEEGAQKLLFYHIKHTCLIAPRPTLDHPGPRGGFSAAARQ